MKRTILYISLVAAALTGSAQNLDETFNVEGIYDVKLTKQERIAQLPSALELRMSNPGLQYSPTAVPVVVNPFLTPLTAIGWQDTFLYDNSRGYLDFGMGSYLDAVASAGIRFVNTDRTKFGVRLQHNSSTAFKPFKAQGEEPAPSARRLFDEYIGLNGSHSLPGIGSIDASLNYRLGYYNYYGLLPDESAFNQPSQTTNSLDVAARFTADAAKRLQWNVGLEYNLFGYRRLYLMDGDKTKGLKQNLLTINGGVSYPLGNSATLRQNIGIDLRADFVMFGSNHPSIANANPIDNYSHFKLNPHYTFINKRLSGRIGATIDLLANAGSVGNRYPAFRIAPDLYAGYRNGLFGIGLQLDGGVELNTLQRNAALFRYTTPWLDSTAPIYSPIDGKISLDFGSFKGLSAQIAFAYKVTNGQPLEGWYIQQLQTPGLSSLNAQHSTLNIHGFSLQASLHYAFAYIVEASVAAKYQPQNGNIGYFNGLDRARWLLDAKLAVRPFKPLQIDLQYQYRGVRKLYAMQPDEQLTYLRLPDITDLSIGASYIVLPNRLTLWLRADNLLGTKAYLNPALPTPGVSVIGGVAVKF